MNKTSKPAAAPAAYSTRTIDLVNRSLPRRYRAEKRFRFYGIGAIALSLLFLSFLFISIAGKGYPAFQKTFIELNIFFDPDVLRQDALATADYSKLVKTSLSQMFPDVTGRREKRDLYGLVSSGAAFKLRNMVLKDPDVIGQTLSVWVTANDDVDMLIKGHFDRTAAEGERRMNDNQIAWIEHLEKDNRIEKRFNRTFFTAGDSREPELAGIWGATVGSFLTLIITLVLSFPIGVASAIYLEEFAPQNRWTDLIEVNINNLAAVPSIVFGLSGTGGLSQFLRAAPFGAAGRRTGVDPHDAADHHHRQPGVAPVRAAVDPGSRSGCRRLEDADGGPSRPAAGPAGNADRDDHRHGQGPGRIRTAAHDRHGGIHRRHTPRIHRSGHGPAGSNLPVGRQPGAGVRRAHIRRHDGVAGLFDRHERRRGHLAQTLRAPVVTRRPTALIKN